MVVKARRDQEVGEKKLGFSGYSFRVVRLKSSRDLLHSNENILNTLNYTTAVVKMVNVMLWGFFLATMKQLFKNSKRVNLISTIKELH